MREVISMITSTVVAAVCVDTHMMTTTIMHCTLVVVYTRVLVSTQQVATPTETHRGTLNNGAIVITTGNKAGICS